MQDNNFDSVQEAARNRAATNINSEMWAKQIVASVHGDVRLAYDFLDTLNAQVTRMLREKK